MRLASVTTRSKKGLFEDLDPIRFIPFFGINWWLELIKK